MGVICFRRASPPAVFFPVGRFAHRTTGDEKAMPVRAPAAEERRPCVRGAGPADGGVRQKQRNNPPAPPLPAGPLTEKVPASGAESGSLKSWPVRAPYGSAQATRHTGSPDSSAAALCPASPKPRSRRGEDAIFRSFPPGGGNKISVDKAGRGRYAVISY